MQNKILPFKGIIGAAIAVIGTSLASLPSAYAVEYVLSACNDGLGCGTGNNYGTINVTADGANTIKIDVDLATNVVWAGTGIIGFAFYLPGISGVTLTNAPAGSVLPSASWTPNTNGAALLTSFNSDGFKVGGSQIANFGLDRTDEGTSSNNSSNLTFDITATGLSLSSFMSWAGNDQPTTPVWFIADLGICTPGGACRTGLVGGTLGVPGPIAGAGVPGLTFAAIGLLAWWRRKRNPVAIAG